jgi:lipopolysaccharide transport system permease protein
MFATPVIYPLSIVQDPMRQLVLLNPLTSLIEFFRFGFLGEGHFTYTQLLFSVIMMMILVGVGSILFNKFGSKLQDVL